MSTTYFFDLPQRVNLSSSAACGPDGIYVKEVCFIICDGSHRLHHMEVQEDMYILDL